MNHSLHKQIYYQNRFLPTTTSTSRINLFSDLKGRVLWQKSSYANLFFVVTTPTALSQISLLWWWNVNWSITFDHKNGIFLSHHIWMILFCSDDRREDGVTRWRIFFRLSIFLDNVAEFVLEDSSTWFRFEYYDFSVHVLWSMWPWIYCIVQYIQQLRIKTLHFTLENLEFCQK